MRVLFLSINNNWTPHFETELELMAKHKEAGDEIFVLACSGVLKACVSNLEHLKTVCMNCKGRFAEGMQRLSIPRANIFYLKKTHGLTFPSFASYDELKKFECMGLPCGLFTATTLIAALRDTGFNVLNEKKIHNYLDTFMTVYLSMLDTLKACKPDRVYIFNGRFPEVASARFACEKLGVDYYTHERGGTCERYSLVKNTTPHSLKGIKEDIERVWHEADPIEREKIGTKWFEDRVNKIEQDWLVYTKNQEKEKLPDGFDRSRKNIAIFNSSMDEYAAFDEWKCDLYDDETSALIDIIDAFAGCNDMHFYVRVHPNLANLENDQIKKLRLLEQKKHAHLTIIWAHEKVDSYVLMQACDTVLTFHSTTGAEASFWGRPSILAGKALYEDLGCCYIPKNRDELIAMIDSNLLPMAKDGAIKYGFWAATFGNVFEKFKPEGLFSGAFLGEKIKPKLSTSEKLLFRVYAKFDNVKLKRLQNSSKG